MFIILWNCLYMSALVGGASYGLHYFAYKNGIEDTDGKISRKIKDPETGKKKKQKYDNHALNKWLDFGGGYYGTVAFVTFVFIEVGQFISFISDWNGVIAYFKNFGIHSIVAFFIDQIKNFVQAIIWPADYFGTYDIIAIACMFGATYLAYRAGKAAAKTTTYI